MNNYKFLLYLIIIFSFLISVKAEKIVYIDMDKIMQISKAGKVAIENINNQKKKDVNKFRKIEEDLKAQEEDLINKKNVLSAEEFNKKIDILKRKINDYRLLRQEAIDSSTKSRLNASADFANKIKPILAEYAGDNNIDMVIQKKNIIMGKSELDITSEILEIVDKKISNLKIN